MNATNGTEIIASAKAVFVTRNNRTLLHNVDLNLHQGEIVTLIGPNGAGKTTLVRVMLNLIKADRGQIYRQADLRIGYMPQKMHIDPSFPVTVQRFLSMTGSTQKEIETTLATIGVDQLLSSPMQRLSGGEVQRVLLARALLRKPQLLVLDEPVQGVDVTGQAEFYRTIAGIRDQLHCGVLMVSHDLHLVMEATDTVVCLNQHVCCHGHPENVGTHPAYLELFGQQAQPGIAVYTHHHDHSHDIHGDVLEQPGRDSDHA